MGLKYPSRGFVAQELEQRGGEAIRNMSQQLQQLNWGEGLNVFQPFCHLFGQIKMCSLKLFSTVSFPTLVFSSLGGFCKLIFEDFLKLFTLAFHIDTGLY